MQMDGYYLPGTYILLHLAGATELASRRRFSVVLLLQNGCVSTGRWRTRPTPAPWSGSTTALLHSMTKKRTLTLLFPTVYSYVATRGPAGDIYRRLGLPSAPHHM